LKHGTIARSRRELNQLAKRPLDQFAEETGERVWCIGEEAGCAVYLYGTRGQRLIQTQTNLGQHTSLHHLVAGKSIIVHLPEDRVDEIIETFGLTEYTAQTIIDPDELRAELETVRELGVAFNIEEEVEGLHAIGAPVMNHSGGVHSAISISGRANWLTRGRLENECSNLVGHIANEIELNMLPAESDEAPR